MSKMINNPIHEFEGEWYFWDENWLNRFGPYETKEEAQKACRYYAENL